MTFLGKMTNLFKEFVENLALLDYPQWYFVILLPFDD